METTNQSSTWLSQKKSILFFILLAFLFAGLTVIPAVRTKLQALLNTQQRVVLAKISGYFSAEQNYYLILKVKDAAGLQIEVYEQSTEPNSQIFKQKFDLSEDSDSYVTLDKNSTNLALQDVDQDGNLDIVTPSVDRNGNLRLNTFRFNSESKLFEPYTKQE